MRRLLLVVVLALTACSSTPPASPAAHTPQRSETALPNRCHLEAKQAMIDALEKDGNLDGLPKTADRSMGIAACKGLTSEQLDAIALALQEELKPYILAAAAKHTATP